MQEEKEQLSPTRKCSHCATSGGDFQHPTTQRFVDHDGRIRVRRSAGERCLPEWPNTRIWDAISYHERSNLLRIEGMPGAIFQQDNARLHVAKTVRDFCSAQLLPWPAYSPDMSPIEHV
ncbi:transposable element Tcb2 transposase [Trichonephila clavipes]|nr:transposable element Tcb2 transposase [Trichonephila clavipes]